MNGEGMNGSGGGQSELAQYEMLAMQMFAPESSQRDRQQATQALLGFTESAGYIPRCQLILDNSKQPYALLLASTSLLRLMTTYWNSFTKEQTVEIRNYLLNYLASYCQDLPSFVVTALIQVLVRITKLGWDKEPAHQEICDSIAKFLQHTPQHCKIGLQMLSELVNEMNTAYSGQTYTTHRKVAVSFRDRSLLKVFRLTVDMLKKLKDRNGNTPNEETTNLLNETLKVAIQCLNFDYIGTNADDASEDGGTIQVPSSWRTILEDHSTLRIFFDIFRITKIPTATQCLEALVLLSATRQSLFNAKDTRIQYFANICRGTVEVIKTRADALSNEDCYHQFCRLLGRLKSNLQLEDLCRMEGHEEWIRLVAEVTIQSFKSWEFASHSVHYLMGLWGRLTLDMPYMKGELPKFLEGFVPEIMDVFIEQRIASIPQAVANSDLDEVFAMHEVSLKHLPNIFKFQYAKSSESLTTRFNELMRKYQECIQAIAAQGANQNLALQLSATENQLAVCVYIIGALVGYNRAIGSVRNEMERMDSEMCSLFFMVMPVLDFRLQKNFAIPGSRHLELAILYQLENFRKRYMGMTTRRVILGPPKDEFDIFARLSQLLRVHTDEKTTLGAILNKILTNLKVWTNDQRILEQSLQLFKDLSSTCMTCKALAEIDTCKALLSNHSVAHFPFLKNPENHRYVTQFYTILARLAFKLDSGDRFEEFMMPFENMFAQMTSGNLRSEDARQAAIQACRQLSGVVAATALKKSYILVFDWIYPKYTNVLLRLLETWWDNPEVTTPILRFYSELVYSRAQRITFPPSSPNGILLFRETSKILSIYATRILTIYQTKDVHKEKLKGVGLCLQILHRSLSGNYVNFGVFTLYGDQALYKALTNVLHLVLSEPLEQYMAYSKVARDFFTFLRVLYANHLDMLVESESKIFNALTSSLHEGLHSFDVGQSSNCAQALDHLFVFVYESSRNKRDPKNVAARVKEHLQQAGPMLDEIMASLFNRMLFDNIENHWSMTRPTLSLLVISRESLTNYQQKLTSRQPEEAKPVLTEAFSQLVTGVLPNVDATNREKFSENMTRFRSTVGKFCVSPR